MPRLRAAPGPGPDPRLHPTGYEQARSVATALAGDWEAARDVRLDLPETGVCSSDLAEAQELRIAIPSRGSCCG